MKTKEKIIEILENSYWDFNASKEWSDKLTDQILDLFKQEKQEIVEEIDKELIKILKVSKTADDYHIGIAYVIDTFLTP